MKVYAGFGLGKVILHVECITKERAWGGAEGIADLTSFISIIILEYNFQ